MTTEQNMKRYDAKGPGFHSTRDAKFILNLIKAFNEGNVEAFTNAVRDYDCISRIDNWKTGILLKFKKKFPEEQPKELPKEQPKEQSGEQQKVQDAYTRFMSLCF